MSKKRGMSTYNKVLWISVLALFISVCCTTYVWADRIEGYTQDTSDALALTPVNLDETEILNVEIVSMNAVLTEEELSKRAVARYKQMKNSESHSMGVEISDDTTVWSMDTLIDIFKISYVNGENEITVNSDMQDKVIAPGTENSYTFRLKNTGSTNATYTLSVEAFFTPDDVQIPVTVRLNRMDGDWIVGSESEYGLVSELNGAEDEGSLSSGKVATYVLDWVWPFESGSDEFDTLLGNRAVDEDLMFTIRINTVAEIDAAPNTGDDSSLGMWMGLTGVSFVLLVLLLVFKKKEEDEPDED